MEPTTANGCSSSTNAFVFLRSNLAPTGLIQYSNSSASTLLYRFRKSSEPNARHYLAIFSTHLDAPKRFAPAPGVVIAFLSYRLQERHRTNHASMRTPVAAYRLALKGEVDRTDDEEIAYTVVPLRSLAEDDKCESGKDDQCYHFLQYLKLRQSEYAISNSIGGNLKAVFE
jgi:hypothetical protein